MSRNASRTVFWVTPAISGLAGVLFLAIGWISGQPGLGAVSLAVLVVFAASIVVLSRYSETVRGLLDRRDERIVRIDQRAIEAGSMALILAIIAGGLVEFARGHSGAPYTWLAALFALAYLVTLAVQRIRG